MMSVRVPHRPPPGSPLYPPLDLPWIYPGSTLDPPWIHSRIPFRIHPQISGWVPWHCTHCLHSRRQVFHTG